MVFSVFYCCKFVLNSKLKFYKCNNVIYIFDKNKIKIKVNILLIVYIVIC